MTTSPRLSAGLAATAILALAACGDNASNGEATTTTTQLNAVDVPQGTISDELMPLDTRNESSVSNAVSVPTDPGGQAAATQTDKPSASDNRSDATDSESETDQ